MPTITTADTLHRQTVRVRNLTTGEISVRVIPYGKVVAVGDTVQAAIWYEYQSKYDVENRAYGSLPICGSDGGVTPGSGLSELIDTADYEVTLGETNTIPVIANPAPNVTITTYGLTTIPLPTGFYTDNAGDSVTIRGFKVGTLGDSLPLPFGFTFDITSGAFAFNNDEFANGTITLRRVVSDTASHGVNDDFDVVINRVERAAIDVAVSAGTLQICYRTPSSATWKAQLEKVGSFVGAWHDMATLSGGADEEGYQFGESVGGASAGTQFIIRISPDASTGIITRSVTVPTGGTLARTNLYTAAS